MRNDQNINVCICTYLRPQHLKSCLFSLINQNPLKKTSYSITVIDNDENKSAEPVVNDLEVQSKVPIYYACEKERGIPFARNRALDESVKLNFDYIAFIDDDEQASRDWLGTLYQYLRSYSSDVVIHGRVIHQFPENTPDYMRYSYYMKKERKTGKKLDTCATNNVIFPTTIVREHKVCFDTSEPHAGGTDTIFFFEVNRKGIPIYECAEAVVYETVFPSRLKMSWLLRRKYRSGITTTWRRIKEGNIKPVLTVKALCKISFHTLGGCFNSVCFNSKDRNKHFLKAAKYTGVLAGIIGMKVDSYRNIDV